MSFAVKDFAGVAGASVIATLVDGAAFFVLTQSDIRAGVAAIFAAVLGGIIHFSLCRWGVFRRFNAHLSTAIPSYVMMSGSAALLQGALVELGSLVWPAILAWLLAKVAIYVCWTFPLSRFVVFRGSTT